MSQNTIQLPQLVGLKIATGKRDDEVTFEMDVTAMRTEEPAQHVAAPLRVDRSETCQPDQFLGDFPGKVDIALAFLTQTPYHMSGQPLDDAVHLEERMQTFRLHAEQQGEVDSKAAREIAATSRIVAVRQAVSDRLEIIA